jgi:Tol biopolymer transport system component
VIGNAEVEAQMRRIAVSPAFAGAARSRQFLEFCVNRAMCGHASELKETTIAVEVFLRTADYNPKVDPIVRVHARRVREKLDLYYRTVGTHDPIRIDLPKGGYVPLILRTLPQRKTDFSDWAVPEPAVAGPALRGLVEETQRVHPVAGGRRQLLLIGYGVVLLLLLGAWVWLARGRDPVAVPVLGILKPWDALPGRVADPAWSPDGQYLAFSAITGGDPLPHIWTQRWSTYNGTADGATASAPVRMTHENQPETRPVWSPDGRQIAFVRRSDQNHFDIVRDDPAAGKMLMVGRFVTFWPLPGDHPALDWSPDGRYLLTSEQTSAADPVRIILVDVATGKRIFLTSPPEGSSGDIEARFSPDGRTVAFRRGGLGDLYTVSIKGEQVQPAVPLTRDTRGVRGIAWMDHGQDILYGTQRGDTSTFELWSIPADGGPPRRVSPAGFDAVDPAVSPNGTVVLVHRQIVDELAAVPLQKNSVSGSSPRGTSASGVDDAHTLLPSGSIDSSPVYSPDGAEIAFVSSRSGWPELWLSRLGASLPVELTHFHGAGLIFLPSWSPDGRSIAFSFRQNGATNIFIYSIASGGLRQLTATAKRDITPVYSNDGRFIYFSSNEDGTSRIWRVRADGTNHPEPLFIEGVIGFAPSPDGKWLYFLREGPQTVLARLNLLDGAAEDVARLPGNRSFINDLEVTRKGIYVAVSQSDLSIARVYKINADTGRGQVAARLRNIAGASVSDLTGFTVSPDGAALVYVRSVRDTRTFYTALLTK